ncbi:MAG: DUF342 domain-containing protein [Candidatus Sumerlaeia bacterium]
MDLSQYKHRVTIPDTPFVIMLNQYKTVAALARVKESDWELDDESFARMAAFIQKSGIQKVDVRGLYQNMPAIMNEGRVHIFAVGVQAEDGKNGEVKYHFETRPAEKQWQQSDSTNIDFRKRNEINNVSEGELLAELIPPTPARDGITVYGHPIKAKDGRPARLRASKNVTINEEEGKAYSDIEGCVKLVKKRISVDYVKYFKSSINFRTGNVEFKGDVVIDGDVNETFTVEAGGSITISGMVDRASLKAGGDITVDGGIYGKEDIQVEAEGDINIGFAENANIRAGGNIYVRSALVNCDTFTEGRLFLRAMGKALIGGATKAICGVDANCLGNPRIPTRTIIEFGVRPELSQRMRLLSIQFEQADKERRLEIREELETLREEYEKQLKARVVARRSTYPGVILKTGKAVFEVKSEISSIVYYKISGKNEISTRAYAAKKRGQKAE